MKIAPHSVPAAAAVSASGAKVATQLAPDTYLLMTHGTSAVLYDQEGYYGDVYVVGPYQINNIASWFNDRASSAYDAWNW